MHYCYGEAGEGCTRCVGVAQRNEFVLNRNLEGAAYILCGRFRVAWCCVPVRLLFSLCVLCMRAKYAARFACGHRRGGCLDNKENESARERRIGVWVARSNHHFGFFLRVHAFYDVCTRVRIGPTQRIFVGDRRAATNIQAHGSVYVVCVI